MVEFAYNRVAAGNPMPGVLIVDNTAPIGQIVDDLLLIDYVMTQDDYVNRVEFLPL